MYKFMAIVITWLVILQVADMLTWAIRKPVKSRKKEDPLWKRVRWAIVASLVAAGMLMMKYVFFPELSVIKNVFDELEVVFWNQWDCWMGMESWRSWIEPAVFYLADIKLMRLCMWEKIYYLRKIAKVKVIEEDISASQLEAILGGDSGCAYL